MLLEEKNKALEENARLIEELKRKLGRECFTKCVRTSLVGSRRSWAVRELMRFFGSQQGPPPGGRRHNGKRSLSPNIMDNSDKTAFQLNTGLFHFWVIRS